MSQSDENENRGQTHAGGTAPDADSAGRTTSTDASLSYSGPPQTQGYPAPDSQPPGGGPQFDYSVQPGHSPGYGPAAPPNPGFPPNPAYGYAPNPAYGYAPYGYAPYGYPPRQGPVRPGGATASAVLMFIQAGVVFISTLYVLFGASVASGFNDRTLETEWTIIGILQLASVGVLIFAGVGLIGGSANSRILAIVACGGQFGFVVYWMIRISTLPEFYDEGASFLFVVPLFYALLPVVSLALGLGKPVTDYIAAKAATPPTGA